MDADTRTLIERTRQRREILNQRFAGMPEAAPRKRRTPVLENGGSEKAVSTNVDPDDSPKRQCLRNVELNVKPDTPAIKSVQSRIKDLKSEDQKDSKDENQLEDAPTPKPRKSVSSPPLERRGGNSPQKSPVKVPSSTSAAASSTRKNRFAALAQSINNWEDDLTHHVIHKEEEKKPRWQPPSTNGKTLGSSTKAVASPVKSASSLPQAAKPASPTKVCGSPVKTLPGSPKKTRAPPAPSDVVTGSPASALARNSPLRASKVEWNRSPKPFSPAYMDNAVSPSKGVIKPVTPVLASPKASTTTSSTYATKPAASTSKSYTPLPQTPAGIPVNAPGLYETPPDHGRTSALDEPTLKPVSQRFSAWAKKVDSPEPSRQPVSAKLANFEQKISQNTPRLGMAGSVPLPKTPKQVPSTNLSTSTPIAPAAVLCSKTPSVPTPASSTSSSAKICDPSELPVSQRMSQMQEKLSKKHHDEPTAYSVGARMSAWEDMTSANKVSDVKKVDPSQTTPFSSNKPRPTSVVTPKFNASVPVTPKSISAPPETISGIPQNPPPPPALPSKTIAASKSFKESIEEKAAEVSKRTGLLYSKCSPVKSVTSPKTVSSGTKGVQQLLAERCQASTTTCSQMAAQNRAARAAELAALSNRYKNGILRDDAQGASSCADAVPPCEQAEEQPVRVEALTPGKDVQLPKTPASSRREAGREKARADFNHKLAEIGLDGSEASSVSSGEIKPSTPSVPVSSKKTNTASIYNLIKKREEDTPTRPEDNKKVKFNDSFDDSDDDSSRKIPKSAAKRQAKTSPDDLEDDEVVFKKPAEQLDTESMECAGENADSMVNNRDILEMSDDDISLRGFVSEAVRRESIFGRPQQQLNRASSSSLDSYDDSDRATVDSEDCLKSGPAIASSSRKGGYQPDLESMGDDDDDDDMEDDSSKRRAVNDLLDDAFDDTMDEYDPDMDPKNVVMRKKQPRKEESDDSYDPDMDINNVVMRKKNKPAQPSYTSSIETTDDDDDNRPYSLQAYRKSATIHQHMMAPVVRSSKYVGKHIEEEDIAMPYAPTAQPRVDDRRAVQERIKELKELVQQEQSIIMQTSNALNKCCVGNPIFAGSSEQVECNRVLLLACQKRQCYMTEIERLKATGQLSHVGPGPQGSLTISDIRLPLKRDFVTKIGTSHDTTTHYFILLIRNGSQLICTQMLSTHDPMMRGSLDFPNLIKINGITGDFKLTLDIYGMSVSREAVGKDKKKKTPKKHKGLPLESPGGPSAVRTTSFSHVTSLELTKKCLDKSSFHLERLSYLSPLYGQIYMRLKCLMESNVEERGFLTMFDDVSGFGAWHRRWCVLTGNKLCIWKYPDDETRKDPMAVIDLKRCVSEKVGLVSRDICARPNTFEMVTVRQPLKGEHDTLITRTYNSTTSVKHLMSADSKEERIVWCNKINRTLANLRTWNADALKPVRPPAPNTGASSSGRR
ncbi:actin-binding protein anillin [Plakobranchus ocellatus]|uniref:Actin-binding protein anillin n=1 Tax=Plakobranchus ocellatus TaxID=259542 RepID=A0AAV4BNW5_9GAST|nr:actin-binding protein anillin [Plakobranchus ocellatus]